VRLERAPQHIVRHGPDEIGFVLEVVWHEEPLSVDCIYKDYSLFVFTLFCCSM
jgi:hypothetical protein